MRFERISVDPSEYVVLDVETNGLRSQEDDLLSISLFKPDDNKAYERFLPLDLNSCIPEEITQINGINEKTLRGKKPLSQDEVNALLEEFNLADRTILHYGALDERFMRRYFERNGLSGFERMHFFNFKKLICSSKYSDGSITKDNLCNMFGIDGVTEVHSGLNDCMLEWKLFKAIGGRHLLVTRSGLKNLVFALNEDYIVPISYLSTYPNLSRLFERPFIACESEVISKLSIDPEGIKKFPTNFAGMTIEHLINTMVDANKAGGIERLIENKEKLDFLGEIDPFADIVPMNFNQDGTVTATREKDKQLEWEINAVNEKLRTRLAPFVRYVLKSEILGEGAVSSQELVVNEDLGILALCDLSTTDAVLEIKGYNAKPEDVAEQLYYEANGRKAYLLTINWKFDERYELRGVELIVYRVNPHPGRKPNKRRDKAVETLSKATEPLGIELVEYESSTLPIKVRCKACGNEWEETYPRLRAGRAQCPICHPRKPKAQQRKPKQDKGARYASRVSERSGGVISVRAEEYKGAKEKIEATCNSCGYRWAIRADHLTERPRCPRCRKGGR